MDLTLFNNSSAVLSLVGLPAVALQFLNILTNVVKATTLERPVNTILYTGYEDEKEKGRADMPATDHILQSLEISQPHPLLIFDYKAPYVKYGKQFNTELLTIARLEQNAELDELLLRTLWQRLWRNRQSRLILLLDDSASVDYIEGIIKLCGKSHAMNVIALQPYMAVVEKSYWTLHAFPTQKAVKLRFPLHYREVFETHVKNMFGQPLHIIKNDIYPAIYFYKNAATNSTLSGYLGRTFSEYAYHYNATIELTLDITNIRYPFVEIVNLLENETADLSTLVLFQEPDHNISYSNVFELNSYCFMVPLEQTLPKFTLYYNIITNTAVLLFVLSIFVISFLWSLITRWKDRKQVLVCDYLIDLSILQGLMGMPFWTTRRSSSDRIRRIIIVTISLAGIIFATAYSAYLESFSVDPPIVSPAKSIDDLLDRGIEIAVTNYSLFWMQKQAYLHKYFPNFTVFQSILEYNYIRSTLDTRYAFFVTPSWAHLQELQKYFSRPLFRLSDICFIKTQPMTIPLVENSIHREPINKFIGRLQAAGLVDHWHKNSLVEFMEMDMVVLEDRNKYYEVEPLKIEDLRVVFAAFVALIILSFICFLLELIIAIKMRRV